MTGRSGPPKWASAVLDRVLPRGTRGASVRADLDDEFRDMVGRRGVSAARRWYVWEATKLVAHFGWEAVRRSGDDPWGRGGDGMMERMAQNVRLAARRFARAPGFTVIALVTMALGIGANVAIFSVVNAVLLEPLPYDEPDELVVIWEWNVPRDRRNNVANPGNYRTWRDESGSFESMGAVSLGQPATVTAGGEPEEAVVQYATPDFFSVLGLEARVGRTFVTGLDTSEGSEAVLSYRYWQRRFGGDASVVGQSIVVNDLPVTVVGVLPSEYIVFGEQTDLWAANSVERGTQSNSGRWLMVVGRLADDRTVEVAREELGAIAAGLQEAHPDFNGGWTVNLVPLKEEVTGDASQALWILLGSVGLLLLIACANVANLFLVRATERQREMAIRTSLGASGKSLAGMLIMESTLIAGAATALGVALAHFGTGALATQVPGVFDLPRIEEVGVDGPVLLFAVAVTVLTGILFGLLPALHAVGSAPAGTLGAEARGPSRRSGAIRNGLAVVEVALSVVLLAGAALLGRSMISLMAVDPGIDPESVLVGRVNLDGAKYEGAEPKIAFFEELLGRLEGEPGVAAAGGITFLPMEGWGAATSFWPGDRPEPAPDERAAADIRNVAGHYFDAMGMRLVAGRAFDDRDRAEAPRAVVVNRHLAETHWPGESALGRSVVVNWDDQEPWEVVGVVDDVRIEGLTEEAREAIYMHYPQAPFFPWLQVTVRADTEPEALTMQIRGVLRSMDSALPLGNVRVMDSIVRRSSARPRMTAVLMAVFAALATLLSAVGLYGVLAYGVSQRVREIGVRVALGARPGDVLAMVVRQGSILAVVGVVIGTLAALAGGRLVSSLLYGIRPTDPWALGGAVAFLLSVAVVASAIPAWRASRVAPSEALRGD